MLPFSVGRFPRSLILIWTLALAGASAQTVPVSLVIAPGKTGAPCTSQASFPRIAVDCTHQLEYLGEFSSDGRYRELSAHRAWRNGQDTRDPYSIHGKPLARPVEVPPYVKLQPQERVVENFEGRIHAVQPIRGQSKMATFRDRLITIAYGREQAILAPQHLVVDSQGRVIVTDPLAGAVHVLNGEESFRITAGDHRHLLRPSGVAIDSADNIYVVDSERALVNVYDPQGHFRRYIGKLDDESQFDRPTGIAIDRTRGRIYLLDSPRNLLVILDLNGNILKRVGNRSSDAIPVEFRYPTQIAVSDREVVVLDAGGTRIQVLNLEGALVHHFNTSASNGIGLPRMNSEMGLAADSEGNIYLSNLQNSTVRVFARDGKVMNSFGRFGNREAQFHSPTGVWVDGTRLYVADTENRRIEVLEIHSTRDDWQNIVASAN